MTPFIRPETSADFAAITSINEQAFRDHPHSQQTEALIVKELRRTGTLSLSLVAEVDGQIVGHIAFSPVETADATRDWYGVGRWR